MAVTPSHVLRHTTFLATLANDHSDPPTAIRTNGHFGHSVQHAHSQLCPPHVRDAHLAAIFPPDTHHISVSNPDSSLALPLASNLSPSL